MKILFLCLVAVYGFDIRYSESSPSEEEIAALIPFENLERVLVCLHDEPSLDQMTRTRSGLKIFDEFPNLYIEYHSVSSCEKEVENDDLNPQTKTIIAAVTPEPFELSFSNIPMYFYDTPRLNGGLEDAFPHAVTPQQNLWHLLKHAFNYHITAHEWNRVAILSDNSPNSQEFENELVANFEEKNLVFTVQWCVGKDCNFDKALRFLKTHDAVIIIANVESRNARTLEQAANRLQMTSSEYLWLVRDWPFKETNQRFQNILSFTLSPTTDAPTDPFKTSPRLNSIWHGLHLISEAVDIVQKNESIDHYYKALHAQINNTYDTSEAFIRRFYSRKPCSMVSKLLIHSSLGIIKSTYTKDSDVHMNDLRDFCLLRNDSFMNPCNDQWAVLISIVWFMFILMVFLLIFFFNRCLLWM